MFERPKKKPDNNRINGNKGFTKYRSLKELYQMKLESDAKKQAASQNKTLEQKADKNADIISGKKNESTSISKIGSGSAVMKKSEGVSSQSSGSVNKSVGAVGQKLPASTKSKMEAGFQSDFSGVKIHNDENAHKMSASLNAKAFTTGSDIYFGKGHYNPNSQKGEHLIAHELTHTLQQSADGGMIQRAEIDTATEGSKKLKDSKDDINAHVNAILKDSKRYTSKVDQYKYVKDQLASGLGWSKIEEWAKDSLPSDKKYDPDISETKYAGVKDVVGSFERGGMWQKDAADFDIINPSILVNGIRVGSDKLGHFFQQGEQYFSIVQSGVTLAEAKKWGEGTEEVGFGLVTTGVYSNADLEANSSGYGFWADFWRNPDMTFDIANYISKSWSEEFNPNSYIPKVGGVVWKNLIDGATRGYISYPSYDSRPLTDAKAQTTLNGTSFKSKYLYSVPDRKGTHVLNMTGTLSYRENKTLGSITGVKITFEWTHSNGLKGTGVLKNYKESLLQGKLSLPHKTDYRTIKLYL